MYEWYVFSCWVPVADNPPVLVAGGRSSSFPDAVKEATDAVRTQALRVRRPMGMADSAAILSIVVQSAPFREEDIIDIVAEESASPVAKIIGDLNL
jgi:hypothetical protein